MSFPHTSSAGTVNHLPLIAISIIFRFACIAGVFPAKAQVVERLYASGPAPAFSPSWKGRLWISQPVSLATYAIKPHPSSKLVNWPDIAIPLNTL
jgi:hypothetical protein